MQEKKQSLFPAVVLGAGPDTAYYTIRPTDHDFQPVRQELDGDVQEELETLKKRAQELDERVSTRWVFEGETLYMRDKGGSQFKWIIENEQIILSIGRGKKTGITGQVRLNSEYLWACHADLGLALQKVHVFLTLIYGQYFTLDMSGLDLAVDVLNLDMDNPHIKEQFISRAIKDKESLAYDDQTPDAGPTAIDRQWKRLTGLTFGRHTSAVSAVIYNKTHEITYQSKEKTWFFDIWRMKAQELGIEYTEDMIVWRVEVRFKRLAFRQFPDVSGAYDALGHLQDLWLYAVGRPGGCADGFPDGWLRYVVPTADTNRARWPIHPAWEVVQRAYDEPVQEDLQQEVDDYLQDHPFESACSLPAKKHKQKGISPSPAPTIEVKPFIRTRKRQVNVKRGVAQVVGWLSTLEAWRSGYEVEKQDDCIESDISGTLHFIMQEGTAYLEEKAIDFNELVHKKRGLYGLEQAIA